MKQNSALDLIIYISSRIFVRQSGRISPKNVPLAGASFDFQALEVLVDRFALSASHFVM